MEINLRPADYVGQRIFYMPRFLKLFGVVCYLLALLALPLGQYFQQQQVDIENVTLTAAIDSGRAEAERLTAAVAAGSLLAARVKLLEGQEAARYLWSAYLRELEKAAGAGVEVTNFTQQDEGITIDALAPSLREATLFVGRVEATESFAEARLMSIDAVDEGFLVTLEAKAAHPAPKPPAEPGQPPEVPGQPPEVPPLPSGQAKTYIVQRGDSLAEIADRFGVSLEALLDANPQIANPRMIMPGQSIFLPAVQGEGRGL